MEQKDLLERLLAEKVLRRAFELRRYANEHIEDPDEFKAAIKTANLDDFIRQAVDENTRVRDVMLARISWTTEEK